MCLENICGPRELVTASAGFMCPSMRWIFMRLCDKWWNLTLMCFRRFVLPSCFPTIFSGKVPVAIVADSSLHLVV